MGRHSLAIDHAELANARRWVPYDLHRVKRRLMLDWIDLGRCAFVDPFFRDTIRRRMQHEPRPLRVRTEAAALGDLDGAERALAPAGFVFHVSRCGSTLLSRMLAAGPRNLVLSEPDPVNELLLHASSIRRPELLLRNLLGALARPRRSSERHLIVKFSSWNLLHETTISRAYPAAPRLFVYRNPIEVLVSVLRSPPGWLLARDDPAGAAILLHSALPARRIASTSAPEYAAAVLSALYTVPLRRFGAETMLVNYEQIDADLLTRVLHHFNVQPEPGQIEKAARLLRYDAKTGRRKRRFRPDAAEKRRSAPAELVALAKRWLQRPYEELERRRSSSEE